MIFFSSKWTHTLEADSKESKTTQIVEKKPCAKEEAKANAKESQTTQITEKKAQPKKN